MKNWKEEVLDSPEMWPDEHIIELEEPFKDDRGFIQMLVNTPIKNVTLIQSNKGAVRANHYHITDWHYMYVLTGSFDYYFRPTGSDDELQCVRVKSGELIFTPPMEDHATVFLEDCDLLAMSRNPRDQETYEEDVRRIVLVDTKTMQIEVKHNFSFNKIKI